MINIVKMSTLTKVTHRFNAVLIKFLMQHFFTKISKLKLILKFLVVETTFYKVISGFFK